MLMRQVSYAYNRLFSGRLPMKVVAVSVAGMFIVFPPDDAIAQTQADATIQFNIPAQPVTSALRAYAHQAEVQLLVLTDGLEAIRANTVVGSYEPGDALLVLLEGTGLHAEHGTDSTVMIRRKQLTSQKIPPLTPGRPFLPANEPADAMHKAGELSVDPADDEHPRTELESIVVTGSRIRGAQTAAPVITMTREDIDRAGFATVEQLIDSWPQNSGAGANQENFTDPFGSVSIGASSGAETSVNLRGLGPDSTLVLVNGRRVTSGGFSGAFVDVSSIPFAAIERVEVLTDGASAIYGADAIGGAVNFILRDDYEGAETRVRVGPDFGADTSDLRLSQLIGKSWNTGNVVLSYEYYHQDNLRSSDRVFAATSDLTHLGGDNFDRPGGNPGNISAGGDRFAIPSGQDGTSLNPSDFIAGTENTRNRRIGQDLLPEQKRQGVFVNLRQSVSEAVEAFVEMRYSKREATTATFRGVLDLVVPDTNPFFVDPTNTGLTSIIIDDYEFFRDLGPQLTDGEIETHAAAVGAQYSLGQGWQAEVFGTYSSERTTTLIKNAVNQAALNAALAETDPRRAFNPFADGSNTPATVLDQLRTSGNGIDVDLALWSAHVSADGPVFQVPGGAAQVATGVEFRQESIQNSSRSGAEFNAVTVNPGVTSDRDTVAAYVELFLPLISSTNRRPGLERFELSLAGRYENYNDFGNSANPKLGVRWSPVHSFSVRGTLGTSFKPPLLTQLETSTNQVIFVPFTPEPTLFQIGGNQDLHAEEATTWTAGVQLAPADISGLNIELTYFDVDFEGRIEQATSSLFAVFDPEFSALLNRSPTQEQIAELARHPGYLNLFGVSADDLISGTVPVGAIADLRLNNVARSKVTGVDLLAEYAVGEIDLGLNINYLFNVEQQLLNSLPLNELVDTVGHPIDLRLRGSATWAHNGWGASAFVNYADSYKDEISEPQRKIDSWFTTDVQLSYEMSNALFEGSKLSLTAQNVFDEDPPFANLERGLGYDPVNSSALGRFVAIELIVPW